MKRIQLIFCAVAAAVALNSCGGGDNSSSNDDSEYYSSESDYEVPALRFNGSRDVLSYLNGKTFRGDGMSISFSNGGQSVFINGTNISNDVKAFDIGVNENGVAYATVQVVNPAGVTTTLALLAVEGNAQLIDPNDGTIYEY